MSRKPLMKSDDILKYIYKNIKKRGVYTYEIDMYDPRERDEDGKPKRNRSHFKSIEAAVSEIKDILQYKTYILTGGTSFKKREIGFHTLLREAEHYYKTQYYSRNPDISEKDKKDRWGKNPGPAYKRIFKDITNIPVETINYAALSIYSNKLLKRNSISYHNKIIAVLIKIFDYAMHIAEVVDKNPASMLKAVPEKINPDYRKPLSDEKVIEILNYFKDSKSLPAWLLAVNNGLRHQDILYIENEHINLEKGYILLPHTKTRGSDPVPKVTPITPYMASVLKKHMEPETKYLFIDKDGNRIKNLRRYREQVKKDLKLGEDFGFHQLRHTFASKLANCDVSGEIISFLMFHSTGISVRNITRRYIHLELNRRIEKMVSYKSHLEAIEIRI